MAKLAAKDREGTLGHNAATLRRVRTFGTLTMAGGAALTVGASLVDLGVFADLPVLASLGNALSAGFLAWFVAIRRQGVVGGWRRYIFLVAGLWFFLTFPTIQLSLLVIPNGAPSFVLLAGVFGILQLLMGVVVREQAGRYAAPSQ